MTQKKNIQKVVVVTLLFLVITSLSVLFTTRRNTLDIQDVKGISSFEIEPTINIIPELNMARFLPYNISAENIPGDPDSVSFELWGKNGDGGTCWDYYVDGTCASTNVIQEMTNSNGTWLSSYIFPDHIYPEIFLANDDVTWNNAPLSTPVRRDDYTIMHFDNAFTMVNEMYFYVEFNAYPVSTSNSADLQVFLVGTGNNITKFNSDWWNGSDVELIGTVDKNSQYHHIHTVNSSHRLIPLATNVDGTVGTKSLDISGDFWIVLYSPAGSNGSSWSLQYQPSELCTYADRWYAGSRRGGWTTTVRSGCPDSHIHVVRRNAEYMDGVEARITATYGEDQLVSDPVSFYFGELPNLPPIATAFINPTTGGTYDGDLTIEWDPSSDPNDGPIAYNIYLKQNDTTVTTLMSAGSGISVVLDTTGYPDGTYTLTGEVCDGVNTCVPFALGGDFTISNTLPIQSLSAITLTSDNSNVEYAKNGDIVTLTFESSGTILDPTVEMYFDGDNGLNTGNLSNTENVWTYTYQVAQDDSNGWVTVIIESTTLDAQYFDTTNSSKVKIDNLAPSVVLITPTPGTYPSTSTPSVTLISDENIFYTTSGSSPDCNVGTNYSSPISISSDTTIQSVVCDDAGNSSGILTSEYLIKEDLTVISISSDNTGSTLAKAGDIVTVEFTTSDTIASALLDVFINNTLVVDNVSAENISGNTWSYEYTVTEDNPNGLVSFEISSTDLYKTFDTTTDSSTVTIDTFAPLLPVASPSAGVYGFAQLVSLSSVGHIVLKYTQDDTVPTCTTGLLYLYPLGINQSDVIKVVACDAAGNQSEIGTFVFFISIANLQVPTRVENIVDTTIDTSTIDDSEEETNTTEEESLDTSSKKEKVEIDSDLTKEKYQVDIIRRGELVYLSELRIKVVDYAGNPIPNILVTIHSEPKVTLTGINGIAVMDNIEVGEHTICFRYEGEIYEQSIVVDEPESEIKSVELNIITMATKKPSEFKVWYWIIGVLLVIFLHILLIVKKRKECKEK